MVGPGVVRVHTLVAACTTLQPLQAVSMQPTPVLSSGLSSEALVSAPNRLAHQQTCISGWGMHQGAWTIYAGLSLFCLLQTHCCALLWVSEAPFLSRLISLLVKGLPRVREPFFFYCFLPGVQVPSQFFFFFSFCPTWLRGDLSCSFGFMRFSLSVQQVFCENFSTCRYVFDVFVGGGELSVLLFCHLAALFLTFWETSTLFSIVIVPIYIPTSRAWLFPFLHILANSCYLLYFQ